MIVTNSHVELLPGENLPEALTGKYELIPGQKYRYQRAFPQCVHLGIKGKSWPCGHIYQTRYCELKVIFPSPTTCMTCKERCVVHTTDSSSEEHKSDANAISGDG